MYNTVGETAGVTQDVGSDPTVGKPDYYHRCRSYCLCSFASPLSSVDPSLPCCTLCGSKIEEEEEEEKEMMMEEGYNEEGEWEYDMEDEEEERGPRETDSVDDAYLSETQYGPDGQVVMTKTSTHVARQKGGAKVTLAEMSQMEEENEENREEDEAEHEQH